tara:strand:- start:73 stop:285 length:213 start_codon:yes stop_codon:yes gene_type:complete
MKGTILKPITRKQYKPIKIESNKMKKTKQKIVNYALNFLLSNIDETTEEDLGMNAEQIERAIENEKETSK